MKEKQLKKPFVYITKLLTEKKLKIKTSNFKNFILFIIFHIIIILFYINCSSNNMELIFREPVFQMNCNRDICPTSRNVYAGDTITMDIEGIDSKASNISWVVTNSPGGEVWDPQGQNAITENFTPYIIGTYNMQVSYDLSGNICICDFDTKVTLKPDEFRIELTWDGAGDVDLHLNSPAMTDPMTEDWETLQDCFFYNENTSWGASLDVDNQDGFGPENIVLDNDLAGGGGGGYHIGVANFDDADDRIATVKIYCGVGNPPIVYNSEPFEEDTFWVVGTINSNDCNFIFIDSYRPYDPSGPDF